MMAFIDRWSLNTGHDQNDYFGTSQSGLLIQVSEYRWPLAQVSL